MIKEPAREIAAQGVEGGDPIGKDFLADHIAAHLLQLAPVAYGEVPKLQQDLRMVIACMKPLTFAQPSPPHAADALDGDGWINTETLKLPPRRYTSHNGMIGTTAADEIWNEAIDACNAAIDAAIAARAEAGGEK